MHRILPDPLWIGHIGDARDIQTLHSEGISALVDLAANEPPITSPRDFVYLRIPIVDGAGNNTWLLKLAVSTSSRLLRQQIPTVIYCSGGMSRSVAIAAAAMATVRGTSLESELERVAQVAKTDVSPGLWHELHAAVAASTVQ